MKTCRNCKCVYADDYAGQCADCGAPMGGIQPNGGTDLSFAYARQIQDGKRENDGETSMKRGRYDGVSLPASILERARSFVTFDESKLEEEDA